MNLFGFTIIGRLLEPASTDHLGNLGRRSLLVLASVATCTGSAGFIRPGWSTPASAYRNEPRIVSDFRTGSFGLRQENRLSGARDERPLDLPMAAAGQELTVEFKNSLFDLEPAAGPLELTLDISPADRPAFVLLPDQPAVWSALSEN